MQWLFGSPRTFPGSVQGSRRCKTIPRYHETCSFDRYGVHSGDRIRVFVDLPDLRGYLKKGVMNAPSPL
jgi:hypothetical protein